MSAPLEVKKQPAQALLGVTSCCRVAILDSLQPHYVLTQNADTLAQGQRALLGAASAQVASGFAHFYCP